MPVYEYKCKDHGIFYELATMEEFQAPKNCPTCAHLSPRVVLIAPEVLSMPSEKRKAMQRNEKSQHQPVFSNKDRRENDDQHASGCGCSSHKPGGTKLMYTAQGDKMFPSMRPWMISH